MKFAAIADVHGNCVAPEAVLADIAGHRIQRLLRPVWPTGSAEYLFAVSTNEIKVGGVRERSINMIGQSHTSHKITAQIASR